MDEPFSGLDAQTRFSMPQLLLHVHERWNTTILFITHDIDEAIFLGDRVGVMGRRPTSLKQEFKIEIPRPRDINQTITGPEFIDLKGMLLRLIRQEAETSS